MTQETFKVILTLSGDSTTFQYLDAEQAEYEILDAEQVVCCRECRFADTPSQTCCVHGIRISVPPDHYCSFGER